jgi:hypothetical protein
MLLPLNGESATALLEVDLVYLVLIQERSFLDKRGQLSAVSDQPKLGKTSGWLNAER